MSPLRAIITAVAAFLFFAALKLTLWDIPKLASHNPETTAFMAERGHTRDVAWVHHDAIPKHLVQMVISAEDARYFEHSGVDWRELDRVITNYKKNGKKRGASTITMQLARNLFLSENRSFLRKALEIGIALEMELLLEKKRILEIYLNVVEFGDGIYGVQKAARHYFGRNATELTVEQGSFLVSILPNPRGWGQWPPSGYIRQRMATISLRSGHPIRNHKSASLKPDAKTGRELEPARPAENTIDDSDTPAEIFFETE